MIGPNGSGNSSHGRSSFTDTSSATVPFASSCRMQSAAKDLEIDPIWKRVSTLIGRPAATSANPRTTAPSVSLPSVTASASPGACVSGRSSSAARPIRSNASSSPVTGFADQSPKKSFSSRAADSAESDPCTMFSPITAA